MTTFMQNMKIVPIGGDERSAALSIFNSPEAKQFVDFYNKDVDVESKITLAMDNVVQSYTEREDDMITEALGLLSSLEMEGAISFRTYKTTFSTTNYLNGYYNLNTGDIYAKLNYTVRGNHSRIAARLANYYLVCMNPAFGVSDAESLEIDTWLEVPNQHSAIYSQEFKFPSPLSDREVIVNVVWKRMNETTIVVTYHPLTSHPKVENKDGESTIRGSFQGSYRMKQLDDGTTEVDWGLHINFGGRLPKILVNEFILPTFNRTVSHQQAFFAYSIELNI